MFKVEQLFFSSAKSLYQSTLQSRLVSREEPLLGRPHARFSPFIGNLSMYLFLLPTLPSVIAVTTASLGAVDRDRDQGPLSFDKLRQA